MNPSEKHLLEIDSVELSFGERRILSGVYLAVETGGVTAVLGRNGCGKSCLMKILCGSLRADFRSMRIDGLWHERFRADEVRYLAQQGFTPGWLSVDRVLRDFGLMWDDLLAWFPLFDRLRDTKIREMSGGERRLLECYLILRSRTQFVLLDEPFSQVAPLHVETLKELIRREKSSKGILLTDHMHRHVTDIADRLYVMANGQTYLAHGDEDLIRYGYLAHL
ncbi:ATP-binding cassette domain-containing protein [Alistipes sp.]|uniref:ATP-binding cassette domain-containing protein n=1 Tax=Alistipes sp. TaxID=1872444 RepID=UPI003AEFD443